MEGFGVFLSMNAELEVGLFLHPCDLLDPIRHHPAFFIFIISTIISTTLHPCIHPFVSVDACIKSGVSSLLLLLLLSLL